MKKKIERFLEDRILEYGWLDIEVNKEGIVLYADYIIDDNNPGREPGFSIKLDDISYIETYQYETEDEKTGVVIKILIPWKNAYKFVYRLIFDCDTKWYGMYI